MRGLRDIFGEPAYHIGERHWQSGFPRPFRGLSAHGVDVIVMASAEVQPDAPAREQIKATCPNLTVILCPYQDVEDQRQLIRLAPMLHVVAESICDHLAAGRRVLVTCSAGRNRSGLISGLVLMKRDSISGAEAVRRIQKVRPDALTNDTFRWYLNNLQ